MLNCSSRSSGAKACLGVLGAALILLFLPSRAWSWGCEGHQAVAMIAEKHMTPHALEMANKVLQASPIDPTLQRFCSNVGLDLLADSATWADDLRSTRPEASPWHYIDIPRDAPFTAIAESCPASTGCVTSALQHQLDLLRSDSTDARTRADALRFVIHFVGDMHQPLHDVTNNDLGGNCVPVDFFGDVPVERNPQTESYTPNLHAAWDYRIIVRLKGTQPVAQWAASLDGQFASRDKAWEQEGINFDAWAWEGHELANSVVYGDLPVPVPVEKPVPMHACSDNNHASTRFLKLHEQISQPYVDAVGSTINEQIAKAGVRLAMLLNQIWQ